MPTRSRFLPAVLPLVMVLGASARADDNIDEQAPPSGPVSLAPTPMLQIHQGTAPEEIDADEPRAPEGYTTVSRTRKGLVIGGAVTLGVSYGAGAMMAVVGETLRSHDENKLGAMWIPLAGPFIQLLAGPVANDKPDPVWAKATMVGLGASQLAGAYLLYRGLTKKKHVFVRNDLVGGLDLAPLAPTSANNHATGMVLSGRF